jgi:transposase
MRVIELTGDRPRLQAMVRPMLAARQALRVQFDALHVMMLKAVRAHAVCRRLLTAPGVGAVTALSFATAIDDPARFVRSRDVGAHLGLTPRKYASGELDRNGALSKSGDRLAREALFVAAHTLLTRVTRWSARQLPSGVAYAGQQLRSLASSPWSCIASGRTAANSAGAARKLPRCKTEY